MQVTIKEFFYLSNLLSLGRLFLIIPFFYLLKLDTQSANITLIVLAVIIILTDFLDGYVSRKMNQVTDLGKLLDPMADKIAMAIGLLGLIIYRDFPVPLVVLLLYRDLMILIIGWIGLNRTGKPESANIFGKLNTTIIALTVLLYLLGIKGLLLQVFLWGSYLMILISGISYELIGEKLLFKKKSTRFFFRCIIIAISIMVVFSMKDFTFF